MQLTGIPDLASWTDIARAFTEGATFDVRDGVATMHIHRIGEVTVTTGRIIACDPLVFPETEPYAQQVPIGRYPVEVAVARLPNGDERIACARLRVSDVPVARWSLATLVGEEPSQLRDDEFFGYPVDAGVGCFMDASAAALLRAAMERVRASDNYYDDVLARDLEATYRPTWSFADHRPDPSRDDNVVVFSSGWGDGFYPSVWGFDAEDRVACLVTDFGSL